MAGRKDSDLQIAKIGMFGVLGAAVIGAIATVIPPLLEDDDPQKPPEHVVVAVETVSVGDDSSSVSASGSVTGATAVLVTLDSGRFGQSWSTEATVHDNGRWTATVTATPPPVPDPASVTAFAVPGKECALGTSCVDSPHAKVQAFVKCIELTHSFASCVDEGDYADAASMEVP